MRALFLDCTLGSRSPIGGMIWDFADVWFELLQPFLYLIKYMKVHKQREKVT